MKQSPPGWITETRPGCVGPFAAGSEFWSQTLASTKGCCILS